MAASRHRYPALIVSKKLVMAASQITNIPVEELLSRDRRQELAWTRFAIIWALRELKPYVYTYPRLAQILGFKDHTSIIHGYRQACAARDEDGLFKYLSDKLLALAKLSDPERALDMEQRSKFGRSSGEIAAAYGVSGARVRQILAKLKANREMAA